MEARFLESRPHLLLWGLIALGLAIFGLLEIAEYFLHENELRLPHIVESLVKLSFEALILAGALGLAVDRFLKKELIRDVGAFIAGWSLPKEIGDKIREAMRATIVRRKMKITYRLTRDGDDVVAEIDESWEIWNYGTRPEKYHSIMVCDLNENPDPAAMRCVLRVLGSTPTTYLADDFQSDGFPQTERGVMKWATKEVFLPIHDPNDLNKRAACTVEWHRKHRLSATYCDRIVFGSPTIGVAVSCSACPDDIEILSDHDDETGNSDRARQWTHERAFMEGQALSVRWWPKVVVQTRPLEGNEGADQE